MIKTAHLFLILIYVTTSLWLIVPSEIGANEKVKDLPWSFKSLTRPSIPPSSSAFEKNAIDRFIHHRLQEAGLSFSPRADRLTLLRRLYYDVLGLPPTPEEIAEFLEDETPDAWERWVDRALSSPHYGERWARHWLDVVRFAESHGFETNRERVNAWPYRDYVIEALNSDKPYNRFILEQLAGDDFGIDVATSFLVGGAFDLVKSPDPKLTMEQRQNELADMVNTTTTAFLGLTAGCARCHDHKFDPIDQKDFYQLQAIFKGVQHGERNVRVSLNADDRKEALELNERLQVIKKSLKNYRILPPVEFDHNIDPIEPIQAQYVRFSIDSTTGGEPCIDEIEIFTQGKRVNVAPNAVELKSSGDLPGYAIHQLKHINDGKYGNAKSWIANSIKNSWVQIKLDKVYTIDRVEWGRDRLGKFRDRLPTRYRIEAGPTEDKMKIVASSEYRLARNSNRKPKFKSPEAQKIYEEYEALQNRLKALTQQRTAYAGRFVNAGPTHLLHRGDPLLPKEKVNPGFISVLKADSLPEATRESKRRLALAKWIADKKNPLTPRVIVNRLWHYHFGQGLVPTPSDFGRGGVAPSHPQLLDWLASEVLDKEWSLKSIHKTILLSHTYQQSNRPHQKGLDRDASGRLYWRFTPRRLEAEPLRDSILATTGALNYQMGGKGFKAFKILLENVNHYFPRESWGPSEWRRMVYMTKYRQEQDAVFGAFDCPDGNQVVPNRSRSNTPLHALNLFNSKFMLQQAEIFAERLHRELPDRSTEEKIQHAFKLTMGRNPKDNEQQSAKALIENNGWLVFTRALLNSSEFLFIP